MTTLPEPWVRMQMCLADIGEDPDIVGPPNHPQFAYTILADAALRPIWMAGSVAARTTDDLTLSHEVCFRCYSEAWTAHRQITDATVEGCTAWRPGVTDCKATR